MEHHSKTYNNKNAIEHGSVKWVNLVNY
jgi:hypothetical protein